MTTVYILKLDNNKYYVGRTSDINTRISEHFDGKGSEWCKINKPVDIIEILQNCNNFEEDKHVKIYMMKYGIDNVRGGSYSKIKLTDAQKKFLQQEIFSVENKCFNCGQLGHLINTCKIKKKIVRKSEYCYKCGGKNHYAKNCYTNKYDSESDSESDDDTCFKCGREGHYVKDCFAKFDIDGNYLHK
jgi:predicted GIY-YIG superfamily endonuclease